MARQLRRRLAVLLGIAILVGEATANVTLFFPATRESVTSENARADALGLKRYTSTAEVAHDARIGILVPVPVKVQGKLPKERRFVLPETAAFLTVLDERFHRETGHRLQVNSAVRPEVVQRRLCRRNKSAAPADGERASSHERGTTVDLSRRMSKRDYRWLVLQLMYYRAIGKILVIEERHCLHVFVGGTSDAQFIP